MPNTRTAKKNIRKNKTRREHNDAQKKVLKDLIREVRKSAAAAKKDEALKNLPMVYKKLDKAAKTNLIKKNKASRLKSRITKAIAKIK
jgi:small subunit ribosomal protein S20